VFKENYWSIGRLYGKELKNMPSEKCDVSLEDEGKKRKTLLNF
jgi:hypothetical protein